MMMSLRPVPPAVVAGLAAATTLSALANAVIPVSLNELATVFSASVSVTSWILTGFSAACALAFALTGWLTTRFGARRSFDTSLALFTLASLMCAAAGSLEALIAWRIAQGFFAGALIPLALTLLLAAFPSRQSAATALWGGASLLGPVAGPLIGSLVTEYLSWRWLFLIHAPLAGLVMVSLRSNACLQLPGPKPVPMDWRGLGVLLLWMACLLGILGVARPEGVQAYAAVLALAMLMAWALRQAIVRARTTQFALLDLTLFARPAFALANAGIGLAYAVGAAHMVMLPLWMHSALGYTVLVSGVVMAVAGLAAFATSGLLAKQGHPVDARWTASLGATLFALVLGMRAFYSTNPSTALHLALSVAHGFSSALIFVPLTTWSLSGCPVDRHASASGVSNFTRSLCGSIGIAVAIPFWEWTARAHGVPVDAGAQAVPFAMSAAHASTIVFGCSALLVLLLIPIIWSKRAFSRGGHHGASRLAGRIDSGS